MSSSGFGLAQIKQEGMCSSFEHPEINSWVGYLNEFNKYFKNKYGIWYLRPFVSALRKIAFSAWENALMTNARNKGV